MEEKPAYLIHDIAFHGLCFYLVWFSTVYLAGKGLSAKFFCLPFALWLGQCLWEQHAKRLRSLLPMMLFFILTGSLTDLVTLQLGLVSFNSNPFVSPIPPLWLIFLWFEFSLVFILLFQHCFQRWKLMVILGGAGFTSAFYVGSLLNAVTLEYGGLSLFFLGAIWACILPYQARLSLHWRTS